MKNDLWVEKYRPKQINEYVFRDDSLKKQVENWVSQKTIPHILLAGPAGTGKCIDGNELIDVEIDITTLSEYDQKLLEKYKI